MRSLIEILVVVGLVALTWQQSLQERVAGLTGGRFGAATAPAPAPAATPAQVVRYVTRPAPTPSGDWMWDPTRRSVLDRPGYQSNDASQRYLDAQGRSYWYDSKGVRHYDP
jgi:hypothetical protein